MRNAQVPGPEPAHEDPSETKRIELELESRVARLVSLGVELEQSIKA
jgi:hypothetical protein